MTKQEIDNLKVGDILIYNDKEAKIEEILVSNCGRIFIFNEKHYNLGNMCGETDLSRTKISVKKQMQYTLETFPENALLIRHKDIKEEIYYILTKSKFGIYYGKDYILYFDYDKDIENYEIGCQVIKDGKIEIEWLPFYQEV